MITFSHEGRIQSIVYEPYTKSVFYSIPREKIILRKYIQEDNTRNQDDIILPIAPFYNGGAINLELDSYKSLLCWLQSITYRSILCSNLNGENVTTVFTISNNPEKIAGFAIDSLNEILYVLTTVSLSHVLVINDLELLKRLTRKLY